MAPPPPATPAEPARLGRVLHVTWWCIAGLSLFGRSGFPTHAIGGAGLDDALFLRLARTMGGGEWLGAFDNTTLVKGMAYPLFILAAFLAGIPLKLAEHGVYLAASLLVSLLVLHGTRARWGATVLFAALAFNPVLWTIELSRVMREGLYISLCLAVIGLLVAAVFRRGSPLSVAGRGLTLGLVTGAYWLTREEGIWLAPAAATVLAVRVFAAGLSRHGLAGLLPAGGALLIAGFAFAPVLGANLAANWRVYGRAERLEVTSTPFVQAYGALSRIEHRSWRRYVVFPAEARALAYGASPAARELQPFLDGEVGARWRAISCRESGAADCSEILSSWFQWALRDAVAAAGHYSSLPEAARYYTALAREVDDACDRGAIPCLPPRATLAPPFHWFYLTDALLRAGHFGTTLLRVGGNTVRTAPSIGNENQIDVFEDTVGLVLRAPQLMTELEGSVELATGTPTVAVRPLTGTETRSDIVLRSPAPQAGPARRLDFELSTTCPTDVCALVVFADGTERAAFRLDSLQAPSRIERPDLVLTIEAAYTHLTRRGLARRTAAITAMARPIGHAYAAILPILAAVGLAALLLVPATRRWDLLRTPLFALLAASAVAVGSRVALVAYLDVTAIPTVGVMYVSPATPFVIVLGVGGLLLLAALRRPRLLPIGAGQERGAAR